MVGGSNVVVGAVAADVCCFVERALGWRPRVCGTANAGPPAVGNSATSSWALGEDAEVAAEENVPLRRRKTAAAAALSSATWGCALVAEAACCVADLAPFSALSCRCGAAVAASLSVSAGWVCCCVCCGGFFLLFLLWFNLIIVLFFF